jgi:Putative antitoxin of bacterial toxin-antitoxin system, YdaS/YdaT
VNPITRAIELVGLQPLAAACGVTYQAVRKWEAQGGCLPRTDWTGETHYADTIEQTTGGRVTKKQLHTLRVVRKPRKKAA